MITRKEYMAGEHGGDAGWANHREYYSQFVTPSIISFVVGQIGEAKIRKSRDRSFNDIPILLWDRLEYNLRIRCQRAVKDCGDTWSLSTASCIAKEAARQWLESQEEAAS